MSGRNAPIAAEAVAQPAGEPGASRASLPVYSVLMSCYAKDVPAYLDAAIASMAEQTVPFRDLVLVCDGPLTDGLDAAIEAWQERLAERMTVVRLPKNGGLGAALAAGMPRCACDVVARMDADDISRPDRMEKLLRKMADERLDLVGGAIEEFDKVPGDLGSVRMPPLGRADIDTWLKGRNPFNHVSVAFDRHMVEKVGGYQPFPWMEDYWLWARMIAAGCRCANVPDVVVDVRVGEGMYARRSNWAYLKSQVRFFRALRGLGLVNRAEEAAAVAQRAAATALPTGLVKAAYNGLLREKSGGCPLVSVVMPAYNARDYIVEAIVSVMAQTFGDWELIVVDDCSHDETADIAEEFAKADPRIRVVRLTANGGVAAARNKGIAEARGAWVALLDSDDWWEPQKLELQLDCAERTGAPIVYCSYDLVGTDSENLGRPFMVPGRTTFDDMLVTSVISCSTALVDATLMRSHPFSPQVFHEDYLLWMTLLREGAEARGCTGVLAHYRQSAGSKSSDKLQSARRRWDVYRRGLGLSAVESARAFARYALAGARKYYL